MLLAKATLRRKWGFRTPAPVFQKQAAMSTPWNYFNKTGEGETGRGHNV